MPVPGLDRAIYLLSASWSSSLSPGEPPDRRTLDEDFPLESDVFLERDGLRRLVVLGMNRDSLPLAAKRCHSTVRQPWEPRQANHNSNV